jgi:hypothetical protein
MTLQYETLFEINILHHYHLDNGDNVYDTLSDDDKLDFSKKYNAGDFLDIYPTGTTRSILGGYHIVCKPTYRGLITGIPYETIGGKAIPQLVPGDNDVFSFAIQLNDPLFANYTVLPLRPQTGMVYYFTNDPAFAPRVFPHLSANAPVYTAAQDYYAGEMLTDNNATPAKLFIAQQKNNLDPADAGTPPGNWVEDALVSGKPLSYAGSADLIQRFSALFTYIVTVAGKLPALTIKNRQGAAVTVETITETGDLNVLKANLESLPEGLYTADIATADLSYTDSFYFYHTTDNTAWGIVDICVKTSDTAYNLLNADTSLRSPEFKLRFKNRSTFWRYKGKDFGAASVSTKPLPLTRQGFIPIKVKDKNNVMVTKDLPNASAVNMIKPETTQIFSDIFI